jgi:hypothetical protein
MFVPRARPRGSCVARRRRSQWREQMGRVLLLSMLAFASTQLAHPSDGVGAATQTILDQRTRAFVAKAGHCIRRALA